ncbi:MAG: hypothetical protein PHV82_04825 [Victivallaceae bacterium]|nr:hypothetical protein [Victivallaceae bacterium]
MHSNYTVHPNIEIIAIANPNEKAFKQDKRLEKIINYAFLPCKIPNNGYFHQTIKNKCWVGLMSENASVIGRYDAIITGIDTGVAINN